MMLSPKRVYQPGESIVQAVIHVHDSPTLGSARGNVHHFHVVDRIVIWNQCVAASLRQSFVVHITAMLPDWVAVR